MTKKITLSETELLRIIRRVIVEQSQEKNIIQCSKLGVKSPGFCHTPTKKPVEYCSKLGVKSPGFCFIDSKKPILSVKTTSSNFSSSNDAANFAAMI